MKEQSLLIFLSCLWSNGSQRHPTNLCACKICLRHPTFQDRISSSI